MRRAALFGALALMASILVQAPGVASAATLRADYRFQGTLASSVPGAPDLQQFGGEIVPSPGFGTETVLGQSRQVWTFPQGAGLTMDTTGVVSNDSYSVAALFRFDDVTGYRSIYNFTNAVSDSGVYVNGGFMHLYSGFVSTERAMAPNRYAQVVFTRDANKNFAIYVGGRLVLSGIDDTDRSLIDAANTLLFFADGGGNSEFGSGAVARIRVWEGPLTAEEAAALDDTPPPISTDPPAPECERDPEAQCGTTGDDHMSIDDGTIITGAGDDTIEGTVNSETSELFIDAGSGADKITLTFEETQLPITVRVAGGGGADTIVVPRNPGALTPNLLGGEGNDIIRVSTTTASPRVASQTTAFGRYVIDSGGGNDRVTAGITADRIKAAAGNDKVDGGAGNDKIDAGGGVDELEGGLGNDDLAGGAGDDVLHGGDGANDFAGGPGRDTCLSDTKKDEFTGCERIRRNHRRNHHPI